MRIFTNINIYFSAFTDPIDTFDYVNCLHFIPNWNGEFGFSLVQVSMFIFEAILHTFPLGILPVDLLGFANISLDATNRIFRYGNDAPYDSLQFEFLRLVIPFWFCDFRPFIDFFVLYVAIPCGNANDFIHCEWGGLLICFDFVFILGYKIRHPISNSDFAGIVLTRRTVRYLFTRNTSSKTARLNGWS